jgi:hypothetical protein
MFVATSPAAIYDAIQTNGLAFEQRGLDYGEAYTFAAGLAFEAPVISNDISAIRTARRRSIPLPPYVVRTYDLIVLCHQTGDLTEQECDGIRQALAGKNEFVPAAFAQASFVEGLRKFYPRLHDSSKAAVGSDVPLLEFDVRLTILPR